MPSDSVDDFSMIYDRDTRVADNGHRECHHPDHHSFSDAVINMVGSFLGDDAERFVAGVESIEL